MKEEMLKFLSGQFPLYFEEREIIREFIETFFKKYQPERLSPEDILEQSYKSANDDPGQLEGIKDWINVCDSPNTANK